MALRRNWKPLGCITRFIYTAPELNDQGSVELLSMILKMEEEHVSWAEIQNSQIEQMGLENYLASQSGIQVN